MTVTVVIGSQWGDEGKGKVVDYLSKDYDLVARYQGGNNAGHTITLGGEAHKFHLIPSGMFRPDKELVIGNGTVLDLEVLKEEIVTVWGGGGDAPNLTVSDRANVIMPYHRELDGKQEKRRGDENIGTTGRGIGPAYTDKISRCGIRVCDLFHSETLRAKIENGLDRAITGSDEAGSKHTIDGLFQRYLELGDFVRPYVCDTAVRINNAISQGKSVLFEGAQGVLLDIDFGTYPYVTSSNPVAGGVTTGAGVGPTRIDNVVGVFKAYTTRVGKGPFPTELRDETGEVLRKKGKEFGTTTGRPRRCGWLDLVALRYAVMVGGITEGALTKTDVLSGFERLKVCTHYEIQGKRTRTFPASVVALRKAKPIYKEIPAWGEFRLASEGAGITERGSLPGELLDYIELIENETRIPVRLLSFGPDRSATAEI